MDRRRTLKLAAGLVLLASTGCKSGLFRSRDKVPGYVPGTQLTPGQPILPGEVPEPPAGVVPAAHAAVPPPPQPTGPAKAATFVAKAQFLQSAAKNPEQPPAKRDELFEGARKTYMQALQIYPNDLAIHRGLASLYADTNNHAAAVEAYRKVTAADPKNHDLWREVADYFARQKDWRASAEAMSIAMQLDRQNIQYKKRMGFILAMGGKVEEGYDYLTEVLKPVDARYNLAQLLQTQGQTEAAKEQLRMGLAESPAHGPSLTLMHDLKRPSSALAAFGG